MHINKMIKHRFTGRDLDTGKRLHLIIWADTTAEAREKARQRLARKGITN